MSIEKVMQDEGFTTYDEIHLKVWGLGGKMSTAKKVIGPSHYINRLQIQPPTLKWVGSYLALESICNPFEKVSVFTVRHVENEYGNKITHFKRWMVDNELKWTKVSKS